MSYTVQGVSKQLCTASHCSVHICQKLRFILCYLKGLLLGFPWEWNSLKQVTTNITIYCVTRNSLQRSNVLRQQKMCTGWIKVWNSTYELDKALLEQGKYIKWTEKKNKKFKYYPQTWPKRRSWSAHFLVWSYVDLFTSWRFTLSSWNFCMKKEKYLKCKTTTGNKKAFRRHGSILSFWNTL